MTNQITARIQIIEGFKSIYNWKGKTEEKGLKLLNTFHCLIMEL